MKSRKERVRSTMSTWLTDEVSVPHDASHVVTVCRVTASLQSLVQRDTVEQNSVVESTNEKVHLEKKDSHAGRQ